MSEPKLFLARPTDVSALLDHWNTALGGDAVMVRLQAPFGGGRRALVSEAMREIADKRDDALLWRVPCSDQENGFNWLIRMYGSLISLLRADTLRRGRAEMVLNAQLPSQPKRVQAWYQQFVTTLKEAKTDAANGQVELRLPKDNPLLALVEVVAGISRRTPIVLELQNPHVVHSLAMTTFVEALLNEAGGSDGGLMMILHDEPESEVTRTSFPMPLLDLYNRTADRTKVQAVASWGADETSAFLSSKELSAGAPARIAEIAGGRPGFIAELVEILQERELLGSDLEGQSFATLTPLDVDSDELEEKDTEEGKPTHATAADADRITYLAALLGQGFPSGVVAAAGGYEPESVDDLVDAMGDLFTEVQFSKEMGTWIYRFSRGSWREGVIESHRSEEDLDLARRMGMFMERNMVPRGVSFAIRTSRLYAENDASGRAHLLRGHALSKDHADMWGLVYDLTNYFDEITWPDNLRKTVWMNLLERLVSVGNVQLAEKVHADATAWATEQGEEEREMTAWLLLNGSRLDARRQDLYRARDRATDALALYQALENQQRVAEIHNHIAMIELQDGNTAAALERVEQAVEAGKVDGPEGQTALIPTVAAVSEHIRGTVARRTGQIPQAAEFFRRANEIAGQTGQPAQAVDSALAFGEALLASGKHKEASDVLGKVTQMTRALGNPMAERSACQLLSQAAAAQRQFDIAIQNGTRALQLSQQLKLAQALPIDLYNLGYFHFASGKPSEALTFLTQAEQHAPQLGGHPIVKEMKYFKGLAHLQTGQDDAAKANLEESASLSEHHKDWGKLTSSLDALGGLAQKRGDNEAAKAHWTRAVELAGQHDALKELRKPLRKKLQAVS